MSASKLNYVQAVDELVLRWKLDPLEAERVVAKASQLGVAKCYPPDAGHPVWVLRRVTGMIAEQRFAVGPRER